MPRTSACDVDWGSIRARRHCAGEQKGRCDICDYRFQDKVEAVLAAARAQHRAEELLRPVQRYEQAKTDIRSSILRSGDQRAVALFDAIVGREDDLSLAMLREMER